MEFLQEICARRKISVTENTDTGALSVTVPVENASVTASCQALSSLVVTDGFYQSKLSVAEKIMEDHMKDLTKQGILSEQLSPNEQRVVKSVI